MAEEKLPQDYNPSVIQRVIEGIKQSIGLSSKKAAQDLFDASQEIKDSIKKLSKKVSDIAAEPGEQQQATYIPAPEDLVVYEFGSWGFAHINAFQRWKYRGKIVGYEFFGTMNVTFIDNDPEKPDFDIHESDYIQKGTHFGATSNYLNTLDPDDAGTHVLDRRLVKPIAKNRLILENTTTGDWGYIGGDGILDLFANPSAYKLRASRNKSDPYDPGGTQSYVEWNDGDTWKIKDYPKQTLFSIGALAIFYKRLGNIYVKARTIGKGHSYSDLTPAVKSSGTSSTTDVPSPNIVMPVHFCGGTKTTECTLDNEDDHDFRPYCPTCKKVVEWSEIVSGTREVDHFSFFGFEACNVEFVYEELDSEYGDFLYRTKRSIYGEDEVFREGDVT